MADEPIDGEENPENDDSGAEEDAPIESQVVETASTSEPAGLVVEAQVVAPNVRKPVPHWVFATVFAVLALGGSLFSVDKWVRSAESSAFADAEERETLEGWQGYLTWAEDQGFWTRNRTPIERHVSHATERRDERHAHSAVETSDWSALCGMLDEFSGDAPAYTTMQTGLERVGIMLRV